MFLALPFWDSGTKVQTRYSTFLLNYFITERELKSGVCVIAQMISEGIEIPQPSEFSQKLKQLAVSVIDSRPRGSTEKVSARCVTTPQT